MTMGSAIIANLQKYSNFSGVSSRSEFWWFQLFLILVVTAAGALWPPLAVLWSMAMVVPYFASWVRRLRDAGLPWGLIFISLVPVVGTIVMIVLWIQPTKAPTSN
jgi:uncharacterized membrane protein YhaH (DUF805 family)